MNKTKYDPPLTRGQHAALFEEFDGKGGDAYSVACRDEVSMTHVADLRDRGFLDEKLALTDQGREECRRLRSQIILSPMQAAVIVRALTLAERALRDEGVGQEADDAFLSVSTQVRRHMRTNETATREILAVMEPRPRPV